MKSSHLSRIMFGIFLSAVLAAGLSGCQKPEDALRYGGQLYADELLLQGLDVWEPYRVNVEHVLFKNPDDLVTAFQSGVVDVALFSDIQTAQIFAAMGDDALIIAAVQRGDRVSTIVRRDSGIESWADLAGKKVALRSGSGAELALKRYFSQNDGLDWDAVEWFNLPVEDMPSALREGTVDAITATEPIPAMAQAGGGMRVLQSYGDCCPAPLILVTTRGFARKNNERLTAFLRGQLDKVTLIQADAALAARTASAQAAIYGLDIPAAAYHIVFKRVNFRLSPDETLISALENTAADLVIAGILDEEPTFQLDTQYLESALEKNSAANP
jgi:ABC-type nitrate/sulfonate/bicarbonate transport system substrate-binding protein